MPEKDFTKETHKIAKVIDKKIQYGENEYTCFACGEKIKSETEVCPYCNTLQDKNESKLK